MKTYKELFLLLQSSNIKNISDWLSTEKWRGKDKQEACLRLFARLGLIPKINDHFNMCTGNFNLNTMQTQECVRDIFFTTRNKEIYINDKGDSSDLTGIHKSNPTHLLVCTSKCINNLSIKKLDIDYIFTNFRQYDEKGYTMTLGIVVKDAQEFYSVIERTERTTAPLKKLIQQHNTIVLDWSDLNNAYHQFKTIYANTPFHELITTKKRPLVLRLHQKLCCLKTIRLRSSTSKILWGHIQRSGKSYMIGGVIIEDSNEKSRCNYLILTTAPNETITQYLQVMECSQLEGFNVVLLDGKSKKPVLKEKNIIICSKQFLQAKLETQKESAKERIRSISWLKNMAFDMRFIDESHNGGTTELAQKTLDYYGKGTFTIYITATYSKPTQDFSIPRENWILWDLEDIQLCKQLENERSKERLIAKHGRDMHDLLQQYTYRQIMEDFSKYPDLNVLTMKLHPDVLTEIRNETTNNLYGWSPESCFLLKQGLDDKNKIVYQQEFQNKVENLRLWYTIFGKHGRYGEYPDDVVFMKRIEKICKNPLTCSRFVGDRDQNVIMAFLPSTNIDIVSQATKQLLEEENVIPDLDILCINSKTTTDPKQSILDAKTRAKNRGKKGVLVLSGRQCSLGVTIEDCDVVLLLNNSNSYDMVFQMMFRCMTEGEGKKRGFVIDPNIHRVVETIMIEYGLVVKPELHPKEAVKYLLQERLLSLNSDHWMQCFGNGSSYLTTLTESIYEVYATRMSGALEGLFKRMTLKQDLFSKNDYDVMRVMFDHLNMSARNIQLVMDLEKLQTSDNNIKKGIEKTPLPTEQPDPSDSFIDEEKRINPIDILRPISIVISLLTIHDEDKTTLEEMFSLVEGSDHKKSILLNQVRVWWGKGATNEQVEGLVRMFQKYLDKDKDTMMILRQVKELFCKNIRNSRELSAIIDQYLIPQENEKKKNAEVSTPRPLRHEMLETIPDEFWKEKKRVFEPCCGKGGFLMDIVDKFMSGLRNVIENEKERYKEIVEQCLYFCDINDMNIFICRLILDPYHEYDLNYHEGDTLKLNVKKKWGVEGFDAVIGNPPYNSEGGIRKGGKNLYTDFTIYAIDNCRRNGLVLYIVPTGILKTTTCHEKTRVFNMLTQHQIQCLNMNDCAKHFHVSSTFTYFLLKKDYSASSVIYNVKSCVNNKLFEQSNADILDLNFVPVILTDASVSIIKKCQKHTLNLQRIDKTSDIGKLSCEKFIYLKRLDHINHKRPYLKVFTGDNTLTIRGPILCTSYNRNVEVLLKSKLFAFLNVVTRFDGVIYHKFMNMFGVDKDCNMNNDEDVYKYYNLTNEEVRLINDVVS